MGNGGWMKKVTALKSNLKASKLDALNDIYIIEEDPIDWEVDPASGLTHQVIEAIKNSKLFIPDTGEWYAKKYPCKGTIISHGDRVRYKLEPGSRVLYAKLGVMRFRHKDKTLCAIREQDIHAIID